MMALIAALLGTGVAFMQWATDENLQGSHAQAAMQAYYCAQAGIVEKGLPWLSAQQAGLLPNSEIALGNGDVADVGSYENVTVRPLTGVQGESDNFSFSQKFVITSIGKVTVPYNENVDKKVIRKAILYLQIRSFVDYMYLTNEETSLTFPGDVVRFFGRDTLWGRVHSNDWIATQNVGGLPVFYDIVSTTKPSFRPGSPNPAGQFLGGPPKFDQPEVLLPELADPIRQGATHTLTAIGEEWRCHIEGTQARFYHWEEGTDFDSLNTPYIPVNCAPYACVFVDGRLEVKGQMAAENCKLTIGCSQDIWLVDDVMLIGTNRTTGALPVNSSSMIGIVSERWIYIDNTMANGREGCAGNYTNHARCHIVITAALVALRGSFQFHQMNDVGDPYNSPVLPDERGNIVLTGSVTQWHRGYVHRSNGGGTGYNKVYHYDNRFKRERPPCFLGATDADGRVFYDIVQWGQASEDPVSVHARPDPLRVRYN